MNLKLHNPDQIVVPFNGRYSLESNRAFIISEADHLIERAFQIIEDYARLLGHGQTHRECREWLTSAQSYAKAKATFFETGKDFRTPHA